MTNTSGLSIFAGVTGFAGLTSGAGITLQSGVSAYAASGSYHASAVHFDGSAALHIASLACTDNAFFSWSAWFKRSVSNTFIFPWVTDPQNNYNNSFSIRGNGANQIETALETGSSELAIANSGTIDTTQWFHILVSADCNHAPGARPCRVYINDVDVTNIDTDAGSAFLLVGNGVPFFFGNDASSEDPFDCADPWIAPGVSLLTAGDITVTDRRKFISAGGKPVNPTGFPSGAILFSGDASTFGTNQGTGGAFTLTGSLTDASTSPSD